MLGMETIARAVPETTAATGRCSPLMTEECGGPMANMVSVMGMLMGRKGGGCFG